MRPRISKSLKGKDLLGIEAELRLRALRIGLRLALRLLCRGLVSAETTDLVHDSLGVEFALEAFESAIDRLSFANDDFRHVISLC